MSKLYKIESATYKAVFGDYYLYESHKPSVGESKSSRIFLFTDRSIYRPGQTVHFKGIAVASENNKSNAIENQKVTVKLNDVNYQEVKSLSLKTNEFGSFNGIFKAILRPGLVKLTP